MEALSSVELTETITYRFDHDRWHGYTILLYVLFGVAGVLVGITTSQSWWATTAILAVGAIYLTALSRLHVLEPRGVPLLGSGRPKSPGSTASTTRRKSTEY